MKALSHTTVGLVSTLLTLAGWVSLAERFDPLSRATHASPGYAALNDTSPTQSCALPCNYSERAVGGLLRPAA